MLIAIEGITGIGKSTLQSLFCQRYKAEAITQEFEKNPYLAWSHAQPGRCDLEREAIFLFMAYHQLANANTFGSLVFSDFFLDKLTVFASTCLSGSELEDLYYPCFRFLRSRLRNPDLIIRLIGSPEFALSNIRRRNRDTEASITEGYLRKLDQAFDNLFYEYRGCDVITVDAEESNLVFNPREIQRLNTLIEQKLPDILAFRS